MVDESFAVRSTLEEQGGTATVEPKMGAPVATMVQTYKPVQQILTMVSRFESQLRAIPWHAGFAALPAGIHHLLDATTKRIQLLRELRCVSSVRMESQEPTGSSAIRRLTLACRTRASPYGVPRRLSEG